MSKPTKQEMSDVLNRILDTHINWSRLNSEDLEKVFKLLSNPAKLGQRLVRSEIVRRFQNRMDQAKGNFMEFAFEFLGD